MLQVFASQGIVLPRRADRQQPARTTTRRRASPASAWCCTTCRTAASTGRARRWSATARPTSQFAANLGIRGFQLRTAQFGGDWDWAGDRARAGRCAAHRATCSATPRKRGSDVEVDLDRIAEPQVRTGLGFFDHMLEQLGKHGGFALALQLRGRPAHRRAPHRRGQRAGAGPGAARGAGRQARHRPLRLHPADGRGAGQRRAGFLRAAVLRVRRRVPARARRRPADRTGAALLPLAVRGARA